MYKLILVKQYISTGDKGLVFGKKAKNEQGIVKADWPGFDD